MARDFIFHWDRVDLETPTHEKWLQYRLQAFIIFASLFIIKSSRDNLEPPENKNPPVCHHSGG
jgi:hypothetical protein